MGAFTWFRPLGPRGCFEVNLQEKETFLALTGLFWAGSMPGVALRLLAFHA